MKRRSMLTKVAILFALKSLVLAGLVLASRSTPSRKIAAPMAAQVCEERVELRIAPATIVPARPVVAPRKTSIRAVALKVDVKELAASQVAGLPTQLAAQGIGAELRAAVASVGTPPAEGSLGLREDAHAGYMAERIAGVFSAGRAGGNARYGEGHGLRADEKPSPLLALADELQ